MNEPLDHLLAQLCNGDMEAAEQVFLAYEPYLRQAVRRHLSVALRAKFDSADIVLSTWADVLRGFRKAGWRFTDADHLRRFLFVATRNRMIDRIRQQQPSLAREEPLGEGDRLHSVSSPGPHPIEVAQAAELWDRILTLCPQEHRPILGLKREGYSLAEIAGRTGLHPDSVRRILRTIARKLAFEKAPMWSESRSSP